MRAVVRAVLLWLGAAAFLAVGILSAVGGEPTILIGFTAFPVVGALILTHDLHNGVGWLLYAIGALWTLSTLLFVTGAIAASPALEAVYSALAWPLWVCMPLIGVIFPTGRAQTRLGQWMLVLTLAVAVVAALATLVWTPMYTSGRDNPLAIPGWLPAVNLVLNVVVPAFAVALVGILVDLGIRWFRSVGTERLQYRWLLFALAVVIVQLMTTGIVSTLLPEGSPLQTVLGVTGIIINLIPIAIYIAISRHGLYDIGRVVSRTITYAIVLVAVIAVYAGTVIGIGSLLPSDSPVPVAASTLLAAAAFLPILRTVERRLDRRFDRSRYDAERIVDEFGAHVQVDVDPLTTVPELRAAVERSLQPVTVGVWLP